MSLYILHIDWCNVELPWKRNHKKGWYNERLHWILFIILSLQSVQLWRWGVSEWVNNKAGGCCFCFSKGKFMRSDRIQYCVWASGSSQRSVRPLHVTDPPLLYIVSAGFSPGGWLGLPAVFLVYAGEIKDTFGTIEVLLDRTIAQRHTCPPVNHSQVTGVCGMWEQRIQLGQLVLCFLLHGSTAHFVFHLFVVYVISVVLYPRFHPD